VLIQTFPQLPLVADDYPAMSACAIPRSKYLGGLREAIPSPPLDLTDKLYLSNSWKKRQNKNKTIAPVKFENDNKY
jgi:hypothetical protein